MIIRKNHFQFLSIFLTIFNAEEERKVLKIRFPILTHPLLCKLNSQVCKTHIHNEIWLLTGDSCPVGHIYLLGRLPAPLFTLLCVGTGI